jgi:hypothetical protein
MPAHVWDNWHADGDGSADLDLVDAFAQVHGLVGSVTKHGAFRSSWSARLSRRAKTAGRLALWAGRVQTGDFTMVSGSGLAPSLSDAETKPRRRR